MQWSTCSTSTVSAAPEHYSISMSKWSVAVADGLLVVLLMLMVMLLTNTDDMVNNANTQNNS